MVLIELDSYLVSPNIGLSESMFCIVEVMGWSLGLQYVYLDKRIFVGLLGAFQYAPKKWLPQIIPRQFPSTLIS